MVVVESQGVGAGCERFRNQRKLDLNDSGTGAEISDLREVEIGDTEFNMPTIQLDAEIAFEHLCVSPGFVGGDEAVAIAINEGKDPFGHRHTRCEVDLDANLTRLNRYQRCLQIFIEPMSEERRRQEAK